MAAKLESGVEFIITDHSFIPKPDLSDIGKKANKAQFEAKTR